MFGRHFLFDADTGGAGGGGQQQTDGQQQAGGQQSQQGSQTGGQQQQTPGPVPYERFKEVNDQLKTFQDQLAQLQAAQKLANEQKLADEKKWQELAEARAKEIDPLKLENLRLRVAMEKGLPTDLIDRLQGKTQEELAADADKLLQFVKPASGPGVPPAGRGGSPAPVDFSKMSPEEIRKAVKGKAIGEVAAKQ